MSLDNPSPYNSGIQTVRYIKSLINWERNKFLDLYEIFIHNPLLKSSRDAGETAGKHGNHSLLPSPQCPFLLQQKHFIVFGFFFISTEPLHTYKFRISFLHVEELREGALLACLRFCMNCRFNSLPTPILRPSNPCGSHPWCQFAKHPVHSLQAKINHSFTFYLPCKERYMFWQQGIYKETPSLLRKV